MPNSSKMQFKSSTRDQSGHRSMNSNLYHDFIADRYSKHHRFYDLENTQGQQSDYTNQGQFEDDSDEEQINRKFEGIRKRVDQSLRQLESLQVEPRVQ